MNYADFYENDDAIFEAYDALDAEEKAIDAEFLAMGYEQFEDEFDELDYILKE
jgi:hypothetical protein